MNRVIAWRCALALEFSLQLAFQVCIFAWATTRSLLARLLGGWLKRADAMGISLDTFNIIQLELHSLSVNKKKGTVGTGVQGYNVQFQKKI